MFQILSFLGTCHLPGWISNNDGLKEIERSQSYNKLNTCNETRFPTVLTNSKIVTSLNFEQSNTIENFEKKIISKADGKIEDLRHRKVSALRQHDKSMGSKSKRNMRYLDKLEDKLNTSREIGFSTNNQVQKESINKILKKFSDKFRNPKDLMNEREQYRKQ